jgi:hypothetical protein
VPQNIPLFVDLTFPSPQGHPKRRCDLTVAQEQPSFSYIPWKPSPYED